MAPDARVRRSATARHPQGGDASKTPPAAASPGTCFRRDLPTRSQAHLMRPSSLPFPRDTALAKPNYNFEKRQREIAKKKQQDEKQAKKRAARESGKPADTGHEPPTDPQ
jgi:hypothetical protein